MDTEDTACSLPRTSCYITIARASLELPTLSNPVKTEKLYHETYNTACGREWFSAVSFGEDAISAKAPCKRVETFDSSHQSSHSHLHPSPSCRNCKIGNARSVQGRGLLTKQGVALEAPDPSRQPRRIHRMGTGVPGGRGCARPRERVCLAAPSFRRSSSPSLTYTQTHHRSPSRFTASSGSRPLFPRAELECTHIYRQSSVKQHEQQE